jgi:hypothetical protein
MSQMTTVSFTDKTLRNLSRLATTSIKTMQKKVKGNVGNGLRNHISESIKEVMRYE